MIRSATSLFPREIVVGFASGCASLCRATLFCTAMFCTATLAATAGGEVPDQGESLSIEKVKFFETHVRPLLADRCYQCHGPDRQRGGLRLDLRGNVLAGGETAPAVVPGSPEESLLVEAIRYESYQMPPDGQLEQQEIDILIRWIELGAPWPGDTGEVAAVGQRIRITDEDRQYWAFQPVQSVEPPMLEQDSWSRTEIDRFVLARLKEAGLEPADPAGRIALARRAYFDLTGLPPTAEELEAFLADDRPDAYERLIDRLIDSPRYGEKWARHWLDLVRYAESDGYRQDKFRPHAWRYRDYVIRSFNDDKPYDQFVMEQLAGDEIMPGDPEGLIANSYLRHWIYEFNQRDVRTQWDNVMNDITDVTADVFLGLGVSCARCHDHKFDPILQRDYYRLQAFFTPLLPRDDLLLASPDEVARYEQELAQWEAQSAELLKQIEEIEAPHRRQVADAAIDKFPPDIRKMMRTAAEKREPFEHQLAEMAYRQVLEEYDSLNVASRLEGEAKEHYESLKEQLAELEQDKPEAPPAAFTVTDVGRTAPPTIMPSHRETIEVEPGFLSVLDPSPAEIVPPEDLPSTGRRTALARWIASPENPLTSRVMVNRLWQYHFGRGLVSTASDFGHLGEEPTHPELLDWLASQFIDQGWQLKPLHRLIMTSSTYRQSALRETPPEAVAVDPDNRLLWRQEIRRLDAEQIRDALLAVTGELRLDEGGPSVDWSVPRRSIYTKVIRNNRDPLLDVFDSADGFTSMARRNVTTTPTQALLMLNSQWTIERARAWADRLYNETDADEAAVIEQAYLGVFGRAPDSQEKEAALGFLAHQSERIRQEQQDAQQLFAPMPKWSGHAAELKPGRHQNRLRMQAIEQLPAGDFTVEALVLLRSTYDDASVRTIVSQWDSNNQNRGWSLGVTSKQSAYEPQNLILQLVGDNDDGQRTYEVVPSDVHLELDRPYYVAVSVRLADTQQSGITFYVKPLDGTEPPLAVSQVAHRVVANVRGDAPLIIGGRHATDRHAWDGLIGDLRLSESALAESELLILSDTIGENSVREDTVGFWRFEPNQQIGHDISPRGNELEMVSETSDDARREAMVDLCHVLLNSNEFIYID